jgi:hypothetical protein
MVWGATKVEEREIINNNQSQAYKDTMDQNIRSIAADYIKYRLQSHGFTWENDGRQENVSPNNIQSLIRVLGDEFEVRFENRYAYLISQLTITDDNAYDTFTASVRELFAGGINWGRIVALFGFSGCFAVRCFELNRPHIVDNLLEWLTTYVDTQLSGWINTHDNWQGLLKFQSGRGESKIHTPWLSFRTLLSCAAAVGALSLGVFYLRNPKTV